MSENDFPDWLPEEYDPDASLRERLPIMAEIEARVELRVGDGQDVEVVHQPKELVESGQGGVVKLRTGSSPEDHLWSWEIVLPEPESGEPYLRSENLDHDIEGNMESRTKEMEGIDVRLFGVDTDRLERAVKGR